MRDRLKPNADLLGRRTAALRRRTQSRLYLGNLELMYVYFRIDPIYGPCLSGDLFQYLDYEDEINNLIKPFKKD